MHVSPMIAAALGRIEQRASDVERAFTPGAQPSFDDAGRAEGSFPTLNPLSVAPPDHAYFVERSGTGERRYTRDGTFAFRNGMLCAADGHAILGYSSERGLADIRLDPVDAALGRARDARIESNGSVEYERTVVDPRSGMPEAQRVVAGRIALARFVAGTRLNEDASGALAAPPGAEPHVGGPGDGNFASVAPMRRESSGIEIDESLDRLRIAYRDFDAMQAVYQAQYGAAKSAMDLVR